jgi:hypothetical protein
LEAKQKREGWSELARGIIIKKFKNFKLNLTFRELTENIRITLIFKAKASRMKNVSFKLKLDASIAEIIFFYLALFNLMNKT